MDKFNTPLTSPAVRIITICFSVNTFSAQNWLGSFSVLIWRSETFSTSLNKPKHLRNPNTPFCPSDRLERYGRIERLRAHVRTDPFIHAGMLSRALHFYDYFCFFVCFSFFFFIESATALMSCVLVMPALIVLFFCGIRL